MADGYMGTIWYEVEARTSGLVNAEREASSSLDRMSQRMQQADQSATRLNQTLSRLAGALKLVIAGSALRQIAGMVQSYQEMSERVQMATSSQAEFEMVQRRLLATANGTYRSLGEAQELYIQTADSLRSMGYSTQQALDVTDSMSYAFVTNATNAQRAESAINAFSGAVTTGKVTADQWRTVVSAIPSVINDIATASGVSSAEVRRLGATGKLTAQQLTEGLRRSLDENAEAAAGMANNLTDAGVRTQIALTQIFVAVENQTGALQGLTNGIISAADALIEFGADSERMAGFLNAAATAAAAYASVIAGRLITSIGAYVATQYRAIQATLQRNAAEASAAQGAVRRAAAERAAAMQALAVAQAEYNAARGTNAHAIAAQSLTAARTRAAAATQAYATAQAAANRVVTAGTLAMTGLRSVMTFLGGPAGVVLLAATALVSFSTRSSEASVSADELRASVNQLAASFRDMNVEQATAEIPIQMRRIADAQHQVTVGQNRVNSIMAELQAPIQRTGQQIELLERQLQDAEQALAGFRRARDDLQGGLVTLEGIRSGTITNSPEAEPVLVSPENTSAQREAKKAADELRRSQEQNASTLNDLAQQLALANVQGRELAQTQAVLGLNSYATQEDINSVRELAGAIYDLEQAERNRDLLNQVDPLAGEQNRYQTQLQNFKQLKEAQLLEEYRYLELVSQAEAAHSENMRRLQEQNFAAQSRSNQLLIDTLNQLESAGTSALTGLITGTVNSTQAMQMLGQAILNEAVGSMVQMGIQWVKSVIMGQTAQAAAAAAGIAQGTVLASAYAPAAAMASLASFGANSAPASAGIAATVGVAKGLAIAGGRQYGGPVAANGMYRINETGAPEVFNAANGRQYMLANQRGQVVSNDQATKGGQMNVIVNNNAPVNVSTDQSGDTVTLTIDEVRRTVASDIARGGSAIPNAMESTYPGVRRRAR